MIVVCFLTQMATSMSHQRDTVFPATSYSGNETSLSPQTVLNSNMLTGGVAIAAALITAAGAGYAGGMFPQTMWLFFAATAVLIPLLLSRTFPRSSGGSKEIPSSDRPLHPHGGDDNIYHPSHLFISPADYPLRYAHKFQWVSPKTTLGFYVFLAVSAVALGYGINAFVEWLAQWEPATVSSAEPAVEEDFAAEALDRDGTGVTGKQRPAISPVKSWFFASVVAATSAFATVTGLGALVQSLSGSPFSLDALSFFSLPNTLFLRPGTAAVATAGLTLLAILVAAGTVANAVRFKQFGPDGEVPYAAASGPTLDVLEYLEGTRAVRYLRESGLLAASAGPMRNADRYD